MKRRGFLLLGRLTVGAYIAAVRPWLLGWGATAAARRRPLPGDGVHPDPVYQTTRAITIRASAPAIWRRLVQLGHDRVRLYTHNWMEQPLLSGLPDTHEIYPHWQELRVGDLVRTNRELQAGHPLDWPVALIVPERALVLTSKNLPIGTSAFVLKSTDEGATRLLCRDRTSVPWQQRPFIHLLDEPLHAYMQTGLLQGIQARAEREASHQTLVAITVQPLWQLR